MKFLYLFILVLLNCSLYSQSIELFSGMALNKFYDTDETRSGSYGEYSSGSELFIGFGIHQINLVDIKFSVTINYEKYGGDILAFSGGMGGGQTIDANISKSVLSIGFHPLNKKLYKQLNINAGVIYSRLINESFSGFSKTTLLLNPSSSTNEALKDLYKDYSSSSYLGIKVGLNYDIDLTDKLIFSPQYSFYYGISDEIIDFPRSLKSMRHYFGIGIKRKLD